MKKINGVRSYDRVDDIYKYISTTQDGVIFARHNAEAFKTLLNGFRASKSEFWAIYGDIGGIDRDGKIYISGRDMLVCSKNFIDVSKSTF
jgi:acyl-CoA synthetase (AMP-forming)/AMP-acid ligase II